MKNLIIEVTELERNEIRETYTNGLNGAKIKEADVSTIQTEAMKAFNSVLSKKYPVLDKLTFEEMFTTEAINCFKNVFKHEIKTRGGMKKVFSMVYGFSKSDAVTIEIDEPVSEASNEPKVQLKNETQNDAITKVEIVKNVPVKPIEKVEDLKTEKATEKVVKTSVEKSTENPTEKKTTKKTKTEKVNPFAEVKGYDDLVKLWEALKADGKNIYSKLTGTEIIGINEYHIDRITYPNSQFGGKGKTRLDVDKLHKKYSIGNVEKDADGTEVLRVNSEKTALLKNVKSYADFLEVIGDDCLIKEMEIICNFTEQEKFPEIFVKDRKKGLYAFYSILNRYFEVK